MGRGISATEPHKGRNSSPPPRMQNLCTLVCLLGVGALHLVHGFGGHFNRYNPALQPNLGYGGGNYYNLYTESKNAVEEPKVIERNRESEGPLEKLLEEVEEDDDPCHARKCTANEHCCEGHVCVDTQIDFTGTCMPMWEKSRAKRVSETTTAKPDLSAWNPPTDRWSAKNPVLERENTVMTVGRAATATSTKDSAALSTEGQECNQKSCVLTSLTQLRALALWLPTRFETTLNIRRRKTNERSSGRLSGP